MEGISTVAPLIIPFGPIEMAAEVKHVAPSNFSKDINWPKIGIILLGLGVIGVVLWHFNKREKVKTAPKEDN